MEARWREWSCEVVVQTTRAADLPIARALVEQVLADVGAVASRFRADSDLSRVNAHPGTWVEVDPLLVSAVEVAVEAARLSDGLVHPLLGRPLVALGYDRTLGLLDDAVDMPCGVTEMPRIDAWRDIAWTDDAVRIPAGTALDLGATAKAWACDLAVAACREQLTGGALVGIGGDLRTLGDAPWRVAVTEDAAGEPVSLLDLVGALATSGTRVRRWRRGGVQHHHVLDPRTGQPTSGRWHTASVAAPTCVAANTASTAAIVLGDDAPGWLRTHGHAARLSSGPGADRVVHLVGGWPADTLEEIA